MVLKVATLVGTLCAQAKKGKQIELGFTVETENTQKPIVSREIDTTFNVITAPSKQKQ